MAKFSRRQFAAFVDPDRVYVFEYRRGASGIEIVEHSSVARGMTDIGDAAEVLVDLIRSGSGPGQPHVTATIRGFGIAYHLLTLPPAGADVLAPVIEREMMRLFPDIADPLVSFAVGGHIDRRTGRPSPSSRGLPERRATSEEILPLEVLATISPRRVVDVVTGTLQGAGIHLDHLTVAPQAMACLFREVSGSPRPAAVVMMLLGAPMIGVFQGGDVRFVADPPASPDALSAADIQTVIDQVGRARIHLRQHSRGAEIEKMYVAAESAEREHVGAVLDAALGVEIVPLAQTIGPPPAILALGGVLNAESGSDMALYPSPDQIRSAAKQRRVNSATVAAVVVCIVALAFAAFNILTLARATDTLRAERAAADARLAGVAPAMGVTRERRANAERIAIMDEHRAKQQQLARVLNGLRLAQPPNVGLTAATFSRTETGWAVSISGRAVGSTGAQVLRGVDAFYRELPRRLPVESQSLDTFEYAAGDGVQGNFTITLLSNASTLR